MPPKRSLKIRRKRANPSVKSSRGSRASGKSGTSRKSKKNRMKTLLLGKELQTYKVPKEKLEAALKIMVAPKNPFHVKQWEEGCHYPAGVANTRTFGAKHPSFRRLLAECRICLLNRDWINLSAILAMAKPLVPVIYTCFMPYLYRYAAICLIYSGEQESLDKFLYSVIGCVTEHDKQVFLRSLTSFCGEEMKQNQRKPRDQSTILIEDSNSN